MFAHTYMVYACDGLFRGVCPSFVGAHCGDYSNYGQPYGSLANPYLRDLRAKCHAIFDTLWYGSRAQFDRATAYQGLAMAMNKTLDNAHFGKFREEECQKAIQLVEDGTVARCCDRINSATSGTTGI